MYRLRRIPLIVALAATLGPVLLVPSTATADGRLSAGWSRTAPYCAVLAGSAEVVCTGDAASLAAAVAQGALGPARNAAQATPGDRDRTAAAAVLIARLYDNADFDTGVGYLDVYGRACTSGKTDIDASQTGLGAYANRVSSFRSYSGCATRLFSATSAGGTSYPASGYLTSSNFVGAAMNDNAESSRFS